MPTKTILLCDDVFAKKEEAKERSRVLRKFTNDLAQRLKNKVRTIAVLDIPKEVITAVDKKSDIEIIKGRPVETILKEVKDPNVEMLVMGTRARSGVKRTFLGSVAEEIVRNAELPVVILGSHAVEADYSIEKKSLKILVISDLSGSSGGAERFAAKFAKRLNAEIVLFHSVGDQIKHMKDMLYSQRVKSAGVEVLFDEMKEFAETSMARKIKAYNNQGLKVTGHIAYEEVEVSKFLKKNDWQNADFIVMGTHSRGRFLKAFLGSTTRRVMLSARVPVIVVRTK
ncbi:universal stress protein [Bdellovibrio sp. KM01]|uniref:universal stress protein n=1 Tax=Bdellovibrio sp. KM01 TaxID=2748865 RepID=UPI0015EA4855|nr:universal stress protein [Bdellovibrio sp. KM01]QLY26397.1 universal stress protein [Bdellovibrio sp. KM01]